MGKWYQTRDGEYKENIAFVFNGWGIVCGPGCEVLSEVEVMKIVSVPNHYVGTWFIRKVLLGDSSNRDLRFLVRAKEYHQVCR